MASLSQMFGGGSVIKSVQRGVGDTQALPGAAVTISAVNPAKSFCNLLSSGSNTVEVVLENSTTVRLMGGVGVRCSWEVIEFY